jgi:hypothetical protein
MTAASFEAPSHVASIELFDSNQFAGATGTVDCGDGPFVCESGFTFSRFFSNSAVAADENGVHVVWASELPSGQNKVFVRNSADGGRPSTTRRRWTASRSATSGSRTSLRPTGC